jgi:hypothetical protein
MKKNIFRKKIWIILALLLLVSAVAYVGNLDKTQEVFIIVGKETMLQSTDRLSAALN